MVITTEQDIVELINRNKSLETEILEFKERKNNIPFANWWKNDAEKRRCVYGYCVGIGNEWWWTLLIWVNDMGEIVWTNAELRNDSQSWIYQKTKQKIWIREINTSKGRVIVISISSRSLGELLKFNGVPLMRVGEELLEMDDSIQTKILFETQSDWSAEIISEASIDDLDSQAIIKARHEFSIKYSGKISQLEIDSWSDEIFLNKAKITRNGKITNTALLLLGKWESDFMISPWTSKVSRILKDRDGLEKDYEHFFAPLIINVDSIYNKIRKLKYRFIKWWSLFPEETDMYDAYVLREMIHNAIVHQDYTLGWKINIVEYEDKIVISNRWSFLPWSVEHVIETDSPSEKYRNSFLANAMVNLRMIDTIWSGIKKSFTIQKNRLFPLPDYDFSDNRVQVTIYWTVLDINYARKLVEIPWLSLSDIMLLDKIQKKKPITTIDAKYLKSKKLIEWRYPHLHISFDIAQKTDQVGDYIMKKANIDEQRNKIFDFIKRHPKWVAKKKIYDFICNNQIFEVWLSEKESKKRLQNILSYLQKDDNRAIKWKWAGINALRSTV